MENKPNGINPRGNAHQSQNEMLPHSLNMVIVKVAKVIRS